MLVWNAETYEQVLKHGGGNWIRRVDFSPDSSRLVAGTDNKTAIVWDLATGKQIQALHHENSWTQKGDRSIAGGMKAWHDCVMIPKEYQIYNNRDGFILS